LVWECGLCSDDADGRMLSCCNNSEPCLRRIGEQCSSREWDIEMDIREHIQQCSCTCNHMGYGNYMDYQQ
ncbi:hypothetical protein L9F63_027764, partial [Diploptera punctata]